MQTGPRFQLSDFLPYALFAALFLPHLGFVPIWDGRQYADALIAAAHFPVRLSDFNIFGHPSMLFMLLAGLPQFVWSGSTIALNVTNFAFGVAGIAAFRTIAGRCFPGDESRTENVLLTSIYAVFPIVVASELNLNPDTGVLVFSLLTTALLLAGRYGWAALAALVLVDSKETGILLYGLIVILYLLVYVLFERMPVRRRVAESIRRTVAFAPIWVFAAVRIGERLSAKGPPQNWKGVTASEIVESFLSLSLTGIHKAYLTEVWVLSFDWIPTAVLTAALVVVLVRIFRRRNRVPHGADPKAVALVVGIGAALLYALTRFPTHTNPRYLLPIFPFFVLAFSISLRVLSRRRAVRLGAIGVFLTLAIVSSFRTVDPVSRAVWGTFPFGEHGILRMTSLTGECCGLGRDQLVYDLEYTHFHAIQNRMWEYLRPTRSTIVVIDPNANWFVHQQLDARTFHRTLRSEDIVIPRFMTTIALSQLPAPPPVFDYVVYPNVDNRVDLTWLDHFYRAADRRAFRDGGYSVELIRFELRGLPGA